MPFWYRRISFSANVPGRYLRAFGAAAPLAAAPVLFRFTVELWPILVRFDFGPLDFLRAGVAVAVARAFLGGMVVVLGWGGAGG